MSCLKFLTSMLFKFKDIVLKCFTKRDMSVTKKAIDTLKKKISPLNTKRHKHKLLGHNFIKLPASVFSVARVS